MELNIRNKFISNSMYNGTLRKFNCSRAPVLRLVGVYVEDNQFVRLGLCPVAVVQYYAGVLRGRWMWNLIRIWKISRFFC